MEIVAYKQLIATPWKNGGGVTREAYRVPTAGEPFDWRISIADIDASGPFSNFSGYVRHMALLRGAGVRLMFDYAGEVVLRDVGDLTEFDGAVATHGELVDGSCTDLNLIVSKRRHSVRSRVLTLDAPQSLELRESESLIVFILDGGASVEDPARGKTTLATWDLVVSSALDGTALRLAPAVTNAPARILVARIRNHRGSA